MYANKNFKSAVGLAIVIVAIYLASHLSAPPPAVDHGKSAAPTAAQRSAEERTTGRSARRPSSDTDDSLARAFEEHRRNVEVEGAGKVVRILPDDNEGLEHQKFILQLSSGQEILIAHNTDVAPRIPSLRKGDVIEFRGEYEWNPQGGVVHWTHHDQRHRHDDGWLKRNGEVFQ